MSKKNRFYNELETQEDEIIEEYDDELLEDTDYDEEIVEDTVYDEEVIEDEEEEVKNDTSKTPDIGTVNCASLNVRKKPSLSSDILKTLKMNDIVIIVDNTNSSFYEIEVEDNETAFVMKEFINL